jgi:hypothetical protein
VSVLEMGIWDGKGDFVRSSGFAPRFALNFGVFCSIEGKQRQSLAVSDPGLLRCRPIKIPSFR